MFRLEEEVEKQSLFERLVEQFPLEWNDDADPLLSERYLVKNDTGKVIETKEELVYRVATALTNDPSQIEKFYHMMASGIFLPNTPTLVNAQRPLAMLSACLVLPTGDSIEEWGRTISDHLIMTKSGIGTGIDLSHIRQKDAMISTTKGEAAGALAFLNLVHEGAKTIRQGSIRPSANMATMRITHPDIIEFIKCKSSEYKYDRTTKKDVKVWDKLQQFNISITATDEEMEALFSGNDIPIIEPHTKKILGWRNGKEILDTIAFYVWDGGDPGLLNLTKANKGNPIVSLINPVTGELFGLKFVTNPCGEQWLYAYSVCNLGSINLTKFVSRGLFDFDKFAIYVEWGVQFLDSVIDANKFPIPEINIMTQHLRNIGLGIMGWADLLLMLEVPYDSDRAINLATEIMSTFKNSVDQSSRELAIKNGVAPVFRGSKHDFRNYERSCIAPTGSIATIIGVSTGIEPNFSYAYTRFTSLKNGAKFHILNDVLKKYIKKHKPDNYYMIIQEILKHNGQVTDRIAYDLLGMKENFFKSSFDVSPEYHIRHQAVFQKFVDNAVSKTINVPEDFTQQDIKNAYKLSWELGCKGITIYRNNSRSYQVLNNGNNTEFIDAETYKEGTSKELTSRTTAQKGTSKNEEKKWEIFSQETLNSIDAVLTKCCTAPHHIKQEGCTTCTNCGWSKCS